MLPQEIPPGLLVTVPYPFPGLTTARVTIKVAVTVLGPFIVTIQVLPLELSHPVQVVGADAAVRVTTVPMLKSYPQVLPQFIPDGELVIVTLLPPTLVTVS